MSPALAATGSDWASPLPEEAAEAAAPARLDLQDTVGLPAFSWRVSAETVQLRWRVGADPLPSGSLVGATWAVLWDTDGDANGVEYAISVSAPHGSVDLWVASGAARGLNAGGWEHVLTLGSRLSGASDFVSDEAGGEVRASLPRATLLDALALTPQSPFVVAAVSAGSMGDPAWSDVVGCVGAEACDDARSAVQVIDADQDGLSMTEEAWLGTDPADADSDDDGRSDGEEGMEAAALGGGPAAMRCDSDGDGLPDGLEAGVVTPSPSTDLAKGCFIADTDPETTTSPQHADTDGGGSPDGAEDRDRDGRVGPWETDPQDPADDVDTDGDGVPDLLDGAPGAGAVVDEDSDGDGIPDAVEGLLDTDGDGLPDFVDLDSDGDGLPDAVEGAEDPDEDGVGNFRDADSDADGVSDAAEGADDVDGDGVPNFLDEDSDGDGLPDAVEGTRDADCDGVPDRVEVDATDGPCGRGRVDPDGFDTARPPRERRTPTSGGCAQAQGSSWLLGDLVLLALLVFGGARRAPRGRR